MLTFLYLDLVKNKVYITKNISNKPFRIAPIDMDKFVNLVIIALDRSINGKRRNIK